MRGIENWITFQFFHFIKMYFTRCRNARRPDSLDSIQNYAKTMKLTNQTRIRKSQRSEDDEGALKNTKKK